MILDKEGLFTFTVDTFAQIFGNSKPEVLVGKKTQTLYKAETAEKFSNNILPELGRQEADSVNFLSISRLSTLARAILLQKFRAGDSPC